MFGLGLTTSCPAEPTNGLTIPQWTIAVGLLMSPTTTQPAAVVLKPRSDSGVWEVKCTGWTVIVRKSSLTPARNTKVSGLSVFSSVWCSRLEEATGKRASQFRQAHIQKEYTHKEERERCGSLFMSSKHIYAFIKYQTPDIEFLVF